MTGCHQPAQQNRAPAGYDLVERCAGRAPDIRRRVAREAPYELNEAELPGPARAPQGDFRQAAGAIATLAVESTDSSS